MPKLMSGTSQTLRIVIVGAYVVGVILAVLGLCLVFLGAAGNTEFSFFGQTFKSTNVGVAAIFIGGAMVVILVRRSLKSVDNVVAMEAAAEHRGHTSELQIISVTRTHDFELDVTLRNIGGEAAVIHTISITVLEDRGVWLPIIRPSAKYDLPIADLRQGETKSIAVTHLVEAHGADRFKIALHTTRALRVRLIFGYNQDQRVSTDVDV